MKPQDEMTASNGSEELTENGVHDKEEVQQGEEREEGDDDAEEAEWLTVEEPERVVEWMAALNALRKSRQYYDVVLVAGGAEVPAHRAVLAGTSPHLLATFSSEPAPLSLRVDAEPDALRALVDYLYTGQLRLKGMQPTLALYTAAWRLRIEPLRAHAADYLLRRLDPLSCLRVRALPDLSPSHTRRLDQYIANNFRKLCEMSALAALPTVRLELLKEGGVGNGVGGPGAGEGPRDMATAGLAYLQHLLQNQKADLETICSRRHLVYTDAESALHDCDYLPASHDDAPELTQYRREIAARVPQPARIRPAVSALVSNRVGARTPAQRWTVLVAEALTDNAILALADAGDSLVQISITWRAASSPLPISPGGGVPELASLSRGRCAHGLAVRQGRLLVCGGYDRTEVLRSVEGYEPALNVWRTLPDMRSPRARFSLASCGDAIYAVGGSDGHNDLDTIDVYRELDGKGSWKSRARMPSAVSHSAVCGVQSEGEGVVYCVGGSETGAAAGLRQVYKYHTVDDKWTHGPDLLTGRSSCCAVYCWDSVWVLGGCDAWHCQDTTERLPLAGGEWEAGPPLMTARRSSSAAYWRGVLLILGGSDGAASLRRVDMLSAPDAQWKSAPNMRERRASLATAVLNNVLYAVGGFSGKEFLPSMECLHSLDGEWTTLRDHKYSPLPQPILTHTINFDEDTKTEAITTNGDH